MVQKTVNAKAKVGLKSNVIVRVSSASDELSTSAAMKISLLSHDQNLKFFSQKALGILRLLWTTSGINLKRIPSTS